MKLRVYQIDAFAGRVFAGNPAVICCLDDWLDDAVLTAIAAEQNISTTAFLINHGDAFDIRFFAPTGELPLAGHASLAAAYVALRVLRPGLSSAVLRRRGGSICVSRFREDMLAIRLPAVPSARCGAEPAGLAEALGGHCVEVLETEDRYYVMMENEAAVAALNPDMDALMRLKPEAVIVTAHGERSEFVSRAFAPKEGLPEDPVCGSAHLTLVPFWSKRLGRSEHRALQLSPRGGELFCALEGDEVRLAGRCALYLEGTIHV
jgi:PhzF family phenazine biosynthesis protein